MAQLTVSVLVPYRPDGDDRDRAWRHVRSWWAVQHPGWQVVTGTCPPGLWRKAVAVDDAFSRATGDVLVVADADVICHGVADAVAVVAAGRAPWAIPHGLVFRLSAAASHAVYGGALPRSQQTRLARPAYWGVEGGGVTVLPRAVYRQVPLDPRFVVWGQEDEAWASALQVLAGRRWRGDAPLWHLWHPPPQRINRRRGNDQGWRLWQRYGQAVKAGPDVMRRLVGEYAPAVRKGAMVDVLGPGWDDAPTWTGRTRAAVLFESVQFPNLDLSNKPGLHGVRFVNGFCEVSRHNAIGILRSVWWQRRGIRVADSQPPPASASLAVKKPTVTIYPAKNTPPRSATPAPHQTVVAVKPQPAPMVPDGTAAEVLAWIGDDPDRARQALAAERQREKPRKSLLTKLRRSAEK